RPPHAAAPLLELLHDLVAIAWLLGEQGEDGAADVAAARARAAAPAEHVQKTERAGKSAGIERAAAMAAAVPPARAAAMAAVTVSAAAPAPSVPAHVEVFPWMMMHVSSSFGCRDSRRDVVDVSRYRKDISRSYGRSIADSPGP